MGVLEDPLWVRGVNTAVDQCNNHTDFHSHYLHVVLRYQAMTLERCGNPNSTLNSAPYKTARWRCPHCSCLQTLCRAIRCFSSKVSKSQITMSAAKPMYVFWPDARYLPLHDTARHDTCVRMKPKMGLISQFSSNDLVKGYWFWKVYSRRKGVLSEQADYSRRIRGRPVLLLQVWECPLLYIPFS